MLAPEGRATCNNGQLPLRRGRRFSDLSQSHLPELISRSRPIFLTVSETAIISLSLSAYLPRFTRVEKGTSTLALATTSQVQ